MNDFYTEQLVKRQTTAKDVAVKAFLVALAIVSVLAVFLFPLAILVPVVAIIIVVALMRRRPYPLFLVYYLLSYKILALLVNLFFTSGGSPLLCPCGSGEGAGYEDDL